MVIGALGSAWRMAPVTVPSQRRASSADAGIQQLEFSLPRSHAQRAGCPLNVVAASFAKSSWLARIAGSAAQSLGEPLTTASPLIARKRCPGLAAVKAQLGNQL